MFVALCKKILYVNLNIVAVPYACVLIILSAIFNQFKVPPSYLSDSKNVFNVYFMKFNDWYVIFFLLTFVICLHLVYGFGYWKNLSIPLLRVLTCSAILRFVSVELNIYGSLVGTCSTSKLNDEELLCELYGFTWSSFDVSGHIFRNFFGMLVIVEEASYHKFWIVIKRFADVNRREMLTDIRRSFSPEQWNKFTSLYKKLSTVIRANLCVLAVLVLLLNIANLLTVVYFHTVIENTVAAVLALVIWALCYRIVFPLFGTIPESMEVYRALLGWERMGELCIETDHLCESQDPLFYSSIQKRPPVVN